MPLGATFPPWAAIPLVRSCERRRRFGSDLRMKVGRAWGQGSAGEWGRGGAHSDVGGFRWGSVALLPPIDRAGRHARGSGSVGAWEYALRCWRLSLRDGGSVAPDEPRREARGRQRERRRSEHVGQVWGTGRRRRDRAGHGIQESSCAGNDGRPQTADDR
jgi:hypothetical protein